MSVVFAATHPDRVSALVLYGGFARVLWAPDYLFGATEREVRKETEEELEAFVTPGGLEALVRPASRPRATTRSGRWRG
jgi:pimeloyl-ACP methyl ester carboxylesterase